MNAIFFRRTMILRITLLMLLLHQTWSSDDKCLTGDMTDVQSWVDAYGNIIAKDSHKQDNTVDVSFNQNPAEMIRSLFSSNTRREDSPVIYLTMARCRLRTVPPVFDLEDPIGSQIARTVEFMTLFGNNFQDFGIYNLEYEATINASDAREVSFGEIYGRLAETTWPKGFRNTTFSKLRQLDLRSCSIQTLDGNVFQGMPSLEALYISNNNIFFVSAKAFAGLKNLLHLDLSRNEVLEKGEGSVLFWENETKNDMLSSLVSLDLSYTRISSSTVHVIGSLGKQLERLSLCYTTTKELAENFFNKTSLKILDVSGNNGILSKGTVLGGTEDTLEVIYADNIGLTSLDSFKGFKNMKIMRAGNNFVTNIDSNVTKTLENLEILSLDYNRMTTWFEPLFRPLGNLKFLSLRHNNINIINAPMIEDMSNITYIGLSGNFFVCSCHVKSFYNVALQNDMRKVKGVTLNKSNKKFKSYHNGYEYFKELTKNRVSMNSLAWGNMDSARSNYEHADGDLSGNFVLYDYGENAYKCLVAHEGKTIDFRDAQTNCLNKYGNSYDEVISTNINKLILIVTIPSIIMLLGLIGYYFRRSFKYFYITLRNSAMLSLISDGKEINEGTIFNYDVFVSYCNEDRAWVLDKLLPQMEKDCSVSVCLHERDFQVGLSILENIVSCMDRSRSIMLIISQRFLLSQWCQFEMHLAQHRLLETRREDLILVLLEDIPRRLRPNTLHYLMLSKTYVQYPEDPHERPAFWRRLKKCLVTQKFRQIENVSLA